MQLANYPAIRTPLDTLALSPAPHCSAALEDVRLYTDRFYTDTRAYARVCAQDGSSFRAPIRFRFFVI